jgi:hypothetical protein
MNLGCLSLRRGPATATDPPAQKWANWLCHLHSSEDSFSKIWISCGSCPARIEQDIKLTGTQKEKRKKKERKKKEKEEKKEKKKENEWQQV